ncbi:hypothetical protein DC498_00365 [Terrimonas sp.]|nr:hypothetical protein DC498_00365 [Terrimonas sp.]
MLKKRSDMKTNIMLVSFNTSILENIGKGVNRKDVALHITGSIENAIEKFQQNGIDIVFVSGDIDTTGKRKLMKILNLHDENVNIIVFDSSADIRTIITNTLYHKMKNNFSFIDDALTDARFNIRVEE